MRGQFSSPVQCVPIQKIQIRREPLTLHDSLSANTIMGTRPLPQTGNGNILKVIRLPVRQ
jgi:hypothetical protein